MKPEEWMEAIENIDDRFIEESAYGVPRKTNIPWGLICAAACFCLVIAGTIFAFREGMVPGPVGPGLPTGSVDTQTPTRGNDPLTPTGIDPAQELRIKDAFMEKYLRFDGGLSFSQGDISVRYMGFYGENIAVFVDGVLGYSQALRTETVGGLEFLFYTGQPLLIYRDDLRQLEELTKAYELGWLTDSQLAQLQIHFTPHPTTEPTAPETTVPEDTVGPVGEESQLSWFRYVFNCLYDSPGKIDLAKLFAAGFPEESRKPTALELQLLKDYDPEYGLIRLPKDRMHVFMLDTFGIALEDMPQECFAGLTYLKETDCYCIMGKDVQTVTDIRIGDSQVQDDGTVLTEYTRSGSEDTYVFAMRWDGGKFRILFNRKGTVQSEQQVLAGQSY